MASVPSAYLGPSAVTRGVSLDSALDGAHSVQRVAAFDAAMARQSGQAAAMQPVQAVAPASAADPAQAPTSAKPVQANEGTDAVRARRALELDGATSAKPANGDMILNGLQHLRGEFNSRISKVNEALASNGIDTKTLFAMQVEVVNFTMLVDMTSKLTGKSTQTFDSLMKGQ
ncbi:hypothetical protein G3545_19000 [Starkeya sp. ORNL1]|uniref:EscI/YscI/HrpB family type III secretion system inner rod protein n=1 Tax=Starkeya sp. ORNL1 TaxID=2709380 RepID=UPI001463A0A0|nr:EscI/YscI/HrpB family type III secretion system inner rod protein [Starkeya sp. ORNL1]QJP15560.1 hypothetical protein G3545_19000 [Starkeya sp. ORNL1]